MTARQMARRLDGLADSVTAGQSADTLAAQLATSRDALSRALRQLNTAKTKGRKA
jgi:hypothetical protein